MAYHYLDVSLLQVELDLVYGTHRTLFSKFMVTYSPSRAILDDDPFCCRLYNLTTVCYHSLYLPLLYVTFLADFFHVPSCL